MKLKLMSVLLALASASAFADLSLESAFYEISSFKAICTDCRTHYRGQSDGRVDGTLNTPNADLDFENHYLLTGNVVINQWDVETGDTRKTVIKNVLLRMHTTGLIAMLSYNGNNRMRITGMSGKSLGDIFASSFFGGKIGANAIVNLKGMLAFNDNGLGIIDSERLFGFGAGIEIVRVRLVFGLNGVKTETVSVDSKTVIEVNNRAIPLKEAFKLKF